MATTAIWKVKGNLGQVVNYAANPDKTTFTTEEIQGLRDVMDYATQGYKTEEQRFVSGVNCIPEIAREQMMMVKRQLARRAVLSLSTATSRLLQVRSHRNRPIRSVWTWLGGCGVTGFKW